MQGKIIKYKLSRGMLLFMAAFLLYSLTSPGNLPGDTEIRWSVARQMAGGAGISVEDTFKKTPQSALGIDGRRYSLWNLGQSLCLMPFAGIALALEKLTPIGPEISDLVGQFLASVIFFPLVGALGVWVFYRLAILLGYSERAAFWGAAVLGFATMHFHYSVATHEQSQVALLLLVAVVLIVKNLSKPRFIYAWLFCVVLGLCLLIRATALVMVLPMYMVVVAAEFWAAEAPNKLKVVGKWLLAGFCGTGGFIAETLWYNYIRFGNVFEMGYKRAFESQWVEYNLFASPPLPTLAAMLFSPGKSIFLYNPVLLLVPVIIYAFYRRHKVVTLAIAAAIVGNFVFYSFFTAWAGDYAWSIRYQAVILPFLVLPLVELFDPSTSLRAVSERSESNRRPLKSFGKTVIILIITVSSMIQLASVVYNFNLEFVQNPNRCIFPDNYVWQWSQSHLWKRVENIAKHIAGKRDFSSAKVINEEPVLLKYNRSEETVRFAYCVNFFPFKAKGMQPSTRLFYPLLCFWSILLVGFCVIVFKLIRFDTGERQKTAACL